MKWFHYTVIIFSIVIFTGCGTEEKPAEPTPDLQAKLKASVELESWFSEARYIFHISSQALDAIDKELQAVDKGSDRGNLAKIIDYFNDSNGLIEGLRNRMATIRQKHQDLTLMPEVDQRILKNLDDLTDTLKKIIDLTSQFPENSLEFRESRSRLLNQYLSIEKLLISDFPQTESTLKNMISPENPDYRTDQRILENIPKPEAEIIESPAPQVMTPVVTPQPSPTPFIAPKVWRDAQGNLVMGQNPPEGVETWEPRGPVSKSEMSPPPTVTSSETPTSDESVSLIWEDEDGNLHMGSSAPEGSKTKRADSIKLMQIE
ncbi:hypothetical protein JW979_00600 [bacterium]|nr:hypothetical protein [candidate division CSSED10-310 bacterium]